MKESNGNMKKLADIPKENFFSAPEGYFDKLPMKIQHRLMTKPSAVYGFPILKVLKYALPVIMFLIVGIIMFYPASKNLQPDAESILAEINTDALVAYLNESELSTDDVLETVAFEKSDLTDLEEDIYDDNLDSRLFEYYINEND